MRGEDERLKVTKKGSVHVRLPQFEVRHSNKDSPHGKAGQSLFGYTSTGSVRVRPFFISLVSGPGCSDSI